MKATYTLKPGGAAIRGNGQLLSNGIFRGIVLPLMILGVIGLLLLIFTAGRWSAGTSQTVTTTTSVPATIPPPVTISIPSRVIVSDPELESRVDTLSLSVISTAVEKKDSSQKTPEQIAEEFRQHLRDHPR
jgi:hypothetical protein